MPGRPADTGTQARAEPDAESRRSGDRDGRMRIAAPPHRDGCALSAPRGRIRRRVPRGPARPLAVLPRLQQRRRDRKSCLVGGPKGAVGHRHRRFHPSRLGGAARRVTGARGAGTAGAAGPNWRPGSGAPCRQAARRKSVSCCRRRSPPFTSGDGATRKVHHLLYAPTFEAASAITAALAKVGNLASDGRPILGLDSRHLLEITLNAGPGCFLIPAHIWTPWFAVLGSKSGFDAVPDCYLDLAEHVFAVETGLSSDPPMNWICSGLDHYRLVSNSDAHSPPMLGREATTFSTAVDYFAMLRALRTGQGLAGTLNFFPEGGRYHADGHRKCGVRLLPAESVRHAGICPKCGKPLTIGVMNRVAELADRPEGYRPPGAAASANLVSLPEIIGEIRGTGRQSKKVTMEVDRLVATLGPGVAHSLRGRHRRYRPHRGQHGCRGHHPAPQGRGDQGSGLRRGVRGDPAVPAGGTGRHGDPVRHPGDRRRWPVRRLRTGSRTGRTDSAVRRVPAAGRGAGRAGTGRAAAGGRGPGGPAAPEAASEPGKGLAGRSLA